MDHKKRKLKIKKKPGKKLAELIIGLSPFRMLAQSFTFVYKGQRPNVALFVRSGEVINGDEQILIEPESNGVLLFFSELLRGEPSQSDLKVIKGSKVSTIDRQTAEEILKFTCLEQKTLKT